MDWCISQPERWPCASSDCEPVDGSLMNGAVLDYPAKARCSHRWNTPHYRIGVVPEEGVWISKSGLNRMRRPPCNSAWSPLRSKLPKTDYVSPVGLTPIYMIYLVVPTRRSWRQSHKRGDICVWYWSSTSLPIPSCCALLGIRERQIRTNYCAPLLNAHPIRNVIF